MGPNGKGENEKLKLKLPYGVVGGVCVSSMDCTDLSANLGAF